jgi:hypothetical protein
MDWQRGEIPFMKLPPDYVMKELVEAEDEEEPLKDEPYVDFKDDE